MKTENIIKDLLDGNISAAKEATDNLLYSKVNEVLGDMKEDITGSVYGIYEKKKKKDDDEDDYAEKTDKEDDGEGLDPVDAEDSDVDNDGDDDESDDYLKNRRKVRKKEIEDDEEVDENLKLAPKSGPGRKAAKALYQDTTTEDEDLDEGSKGDGRAKYIYGIEIKKYEKLTDALKSKIKAKWHATQSKKEKEKET